MLLTILLCALLIGADQLIKMLVSANLAPDGAARLIPGFIELRYVENTGAAFNVLAGKQGFLIAVTGIALLVVGYILLRRTKRFSLEYFAFLLIFSGGVGNLIDRVTSGFVVDYLNFQFMSFAVFNLADVLVCVGFGLLVLSFILGEVKARRAKAQNAPAAGEETIATTVNEAADTAPQDNGND